MRSGIEKIGKTQKRSETCVRRTVINKIKWKEKKTRKKAWQTERKENHQWSSCLLILYFTSQDVTDRTKQNRKVQPFKCTIGGIREHDCGNSHDSSCLDATHTHFQWLHEIGIEIFSLIESQKTDDESGTASNWIFFIACFLRPLLFSSLIRVLNSRKCDKVSSE